MAIKERPAPRLLVVGYNAWDTLVLLPRWPEPDTKLEVPRLVQGGGGPAATAAVAAARLGAVVSLVTVLADDPAGDWQRRELAAAGVDLSRCPAAPGAATPLAVSLVDPADGGRRILWRRGSLPPLDPDRVDPAWLDDHDLLLCDAHEPAAAQVLARAARERGKPVVLDAGTPRRGVPELAALCSDVIASEHYPGQATGLEDPLAALRRLAAALPGRVAVTCGARGVVWWEEGRPRHRPAFAVAAVDTTGAGDVFHGAYAVARAEGRPLPAALDFAAAAAALACRDLGGRAALPERREVAELLARGRRRADRPAWLPADDPREVDGTGPAD